MTALFDEKARQKMKAQYKESDFVFENVEVRQIVVKEIDKSIGRQYIASFHYSKTFPDSTRFCYGAFYKGKIIGVVCYGMGCGKNQYTSIMPNIQNGEYIELTRLWVANSMPKNSESWIISKSLKLLPKEIKLVLSFADSLENHCGIIYQATNWFYLGKNNGGKMLVMNNGIKKHPRLLGIYRMRHPEYKDLKNEELMELIGVKYCDGGMKHRYVYLRGKDKKKNKELIKDRIEKYPKQDKKQGLTEKELLDF